MPEAPASSPVDLHVEFDPLISYAMSQNAIPALREVRVTNRGDAPLAELSIQVRFEPEVAAPWDSFLPVLAPEATHRTEDLPLVFDHGRLMNLDERERGRCFVAVLQGQDVLVTQPLDIELLAYNEWRADTLPQLLSTFVQPNHPVVAETLNLARKHLERLTGDPALEGYQSRDPARVRAVAQAIYQTIQELGITYANPLASFRGAGQKVRTPDQVLTQQMGTCLDLALFYAACLEQVGLGTLLVVLDRHAYAGVWLDKDHPANVLWDDAAMVRNEVDSGKLLLVDSSTMAHRPVVGFDRAVSTGRTLLDQRFDYMIDVTCARAEKILPLPSRVAAGRFEPAPTVVVRAEPLDPATERRVKELLRAAEAAGARVSQARGRAPEVPEDVKERLERWRSRLLDLSLRNGLLSTRSKKLITFLPPDLARLEDELAKGAPFSIHPRTQAFSKDDPRSAEIYKAHTGGDALVELAGQALTSNKLLTHLDEDALESRLTELARNGRTSMEEGGAHTIYLALGMLSWYESESSTTERLAPILLIPVRLHRETARQRYKLSLADEESTFNVTLLEKLRQDFGIDIPELNGDLPQDDAGLDVPAIFNHVRAAIRGMRRWEVKHDVALSQFSFSKLLMWRDLGTHAHHLLESEVVKHLAKGGKDAFPDQGDFPAEDRLDRDLTLAEFPCPKDADSSQIVAIEAARSGKSFVLQGPPGTGKSQTITNLIAALLAQGKSVLFVSEKMAALEVVHERLKQVGLSDFCLELHSNKARKKEIVEKLGATLDLDRPSPPPQWRSVVQELSQASVSLNGYVDALHKPRHNGFSAFQGFSALAGVQTAPVVGMSLGSSATLTPERLRALEGTVRGFTSALTEVGDLGAHPFRASRLAAFDPVLAQRVPEACQAAILTLGALREATDQVRVRFLSRNGLQSASELQQFAKFAQAIVASAGPSLALLTEPNVDAASQSLHEYASLGARCDALNSQLASQWDAALFDLDLQGLVARLRQWTGAFFLIAFVMLWGARKALRRVVRSPRLPGNKELLGQLEQAVEVRGLSVGLQRMSQEVIRWVGKTATAADRWQRIAAQADSAVALRAAADTAGLEAAVSGPLLQLASQEHQRDASATADRQLLQRFATAWQEFASARDAVLALVHAEDRTAFGASPAYLERVERLLNEWATRPQKLRPITLLRAEEAEMAKAALGNLAQAVLSSQVSVVQALPALQKAFHTAWVNDLVRDDAVLSRFSSRAQAEAIRRFSDLDAQYIEIAGTQVAGDVASRLPRAGGTGGEVGILRRELQKQRKHLPIRLLFEKIPTLLRRLKPCMLMSPLSVAQYLQPGLAAFDIVVFDEASQIPVPDAIGAIARGRQLVVVGDSKQLPPTNFFGRTADADDESPISEDTAEELESILDECLAAQVPQLSLKWHYRSQHESLITFSNYHYYENRLLTFPAADDRRHVMGVSHVDVPGGVYESGKNRYNRGEAEAVVAEVVRRLRDVKERVRSVGVVTFSQAQMGLIETLLDEARRKHPEIEAYFGEGARERVFVKNLENVQGDERDVIIFSVGYGPDQTGRVSMNFGPLNRQGGERRLNVAVTRARQQLVVYSTLSADQIDLRRTRAVGARHLQAFLDYAKRGPKAIAQATSSDPAARFDSPFEQRVHEMLVNRGWDVEPQVGCSGYRIDLAIRDRDRPGHYLAGVECDGAYYHRAKTARDRDRLRQAVLESLGWSLLRIWSTDFWLDPEAAVDVVHAALTRLQEAARRNEKTLVGANAPVQATVAEPVAPVQAVAPRVSARTSAAAALETPVAQSRPTSMPPVPQVAAKAYDGKSANPSREPSTYSLASMPPFLGGDQDFYDISFNTRIVQCIVGVLAVEAPVHRRILARRVMSPFCLERATARVNERIEKLFTLAGARSDADFVWPATLDLSRWSAFRVPSIDPETARKPEEIHAIELSNAAIYLLELNLGMDREELRREMAVLFGVRRVTPNILSDMERGVRHLLESGRAIEQGGRLVPRG